jgi:fibronectin type 3 domain-containing protein
MFARSVSVPLSLLHKVTQADSGKPRTSRFFYVRSSYISPQKASRGVTNRRTAPILGKKREEEAQPPAQKAAEEQIPLKKTGELLPTKSLTSRGKFFKPTGNMKRFTTLMQPAATGQWSPETISKNGASPKSQTSRRNFKLRALSTLMLSALAFVSCKEDDNNNASFLAAPTNVKASQQGQCVVLSWNSVPSATYYEVYRSSTISPNSAYESIVYAEEAGAEDWGPLTGDNYYKIRAVKESGSSEIKSDFSSAAYYRYLSNTSGGGGSDSSGNGNGGSGGDGGGSGGVTTPSAPTGVTATAISSSSISVSWNAVSGATSYEVYYEIGASSTKNFAGTTYSTSYTHTGLTASTNYYYYIKAANSAGKSGYSSHAYATTSSSSGGGGGGATTPSAPIGVTASAVSSSSINVSWNSVSGATSYKVYYEIGSSSTKNLAGTAYSTSYTHTGLTASTTYYYYIKAVNSAGESGYSSHAYATTSSSGGGGGGTSYSPCPVTYGNCTVSGTTITMRWTTPTSFGCGTPTTAYLRVKHPNNNEYTNVQTLSGSATSASFTYTPWVNSEGYIYVGIITENDRGTSGGTPKIYNNKTKQWIN